MQEKGSGLTYALLLNLSWLSTVETNHAGLDSWPGSGVQRLCRVLGPQKILRSSNDPIGKNIHNLLPHHFYFPFSIWRKSSLKTLAYVKKATSCLMWKRYLLNTYQTFTVTGICWVHLYSSWFQQLHNLNIVTAKFCMRKRNFRERK